MKVAELCRRRGISDATPYKWKAKYGGMEVSDAKKLEALEAWNAKLKKLVADLRLDKVALQDPALKKTGNACCSKRSRGTGTKASRFFRAAGVCGCGAASVTRATRMTKHRMNA